MTRLPPNERGRRRRQRWGTTCSLVICVQWVVYVLVVIGPMSAAQEEPTGTPQEEPSVIPQEEPSLVPEGEPSLVPQGPSVEPEEIPTALPSSSVMEPVPTAIPSVSPSTLMPTIAPTGAPTATMRPTTSLRPSNAPTVSLQPTNTPTDSPMPTSTPKPSIKPSSAPTQSAAPTMNPTQTAKPTTSDMPSLVPTHSPAPTISPTATPTQTPSRSPTMELIYTADEFNFAMTLDGFPPFNATNASIPGIRLWEQTTSQHVVTYWASRNYSDFNITQVTTNFEQNLSTLATPLDEPDIPYLPITTIIYDQRIQFTVKGLDSPVLPGNGSDTRKLFFYPFETDSQNYSDTLQYRFRIDNRIFMTNFTQIPTRPPSMPTPAPVPDSPTPARSITDEGIGSAAIVAAVVSTVVFLAIVAFFLVWFCTRRKPVEEFNDDAFSGEPIIVEEPPGYAVEESERNMVQAAAQSIKLDAVPPIKEPALDRTIPDTEMNEEEVNDDGRQYSQSSSLHIGIPLEEGEEEEEANSGVVEYGFFPRDMPLTDSIIEAQRPSMSGFALKISELEE